MSDAATLVYAVGYDQGWDGDVVRAVYLDATLAEEAARLLGLTVWTFDLQTGLPRRVTWHSAEGWVPAPADAAKVPRGSLKHVYTEDARWEFPPVDERVHTTFGPTNTRYGARYTARGVNRVAVIHEMARLRLRALKELGYGAPDPRRRVSR